MLAMLASRVADRQERTAVNVIATAGSLQVVSLRLNFFGREGCSVRRIGGGKEKWRKEGGEAGEEGCLSGREGMVERWREAERDGVIEEGTEEERKRGRDSWWDEGRREGGRGRARYEGIYEGSERKRGREIERQRGTQEGRERGKHA